MSDGVVTIFNYIDQILFSKRERKDSIDSDPAFTGFMLNRWSSMCSPMHAEIINETLNKYLSTLQSKDSQYDFLLHIIPQTKRKKINYIKKVKKATTSKKKEEEFNLVKEYAKTKEISQREVLMYDLF